VKIIAINKKGRNFSIEFDDNSALLLDGELLSKFNLHLDLELSESEFKLLVAESEYRKAFSSALRILARRSHSVSEIKIKLKQKKHNSEAVSRVISKLNKLNYLDDEKFTEEYIDYAMRTRKLGPLRLVHELSKKGVSGEIINNSLAGRNEEAFIRNAALHAEKKINTLNTDILEKEKIRQRLFSYLQQKGYDSGIIYQVLNNMNY
jgi:regulatory protein